MLEVVNIAKAYKKQSVIHGINGSFAQGVTLISGPSGSGKSTLLRLLATLEKPSTGHILWQGNNTAKAKRQYRKVLGYAPQQIDFPEELSAMDFLIHIGALKGLTHRHCIAQGSELLAQLGLEPAKAQKIATYSGGMRRRLGLAQAFLGQPQCLVIDEPTAELDADTAAQVNKLIFDYAERAVVVMTTHLPQYVSDYRYKCFSLNGQGTQ